MSTFVRVNTKAGKQIRFATKESNISGSIGVSSRYGSLDETVESEIKEQIAPFLDMARDIKEASSDQFNGELTLWLKMDSEQGLVAVQEGAHIELRLKWPAADG